MSRPACQACGKELRFCSGEGIYPDCPGRRYGDRVGTSPPFSPPGNLDQFVACCLSWETKTGEDAKQKSPRKRLRSSLLRAPIHTPLPRQACQRRLLPQRIRQTLNKPGAARTYRILVWEGLFTQLAPRDFREGNLEGPLPPFVSPFFPTCSSDFRLAVQRKK
jgi:hypothetical protein